jgi:Uma2 family endonuclease
MRAGALAHRLGERAIEMVAVGMRLTLEEFLALPEEKPALEYIDGMVDQKMSPKGQHSWLQGALIRLLGEAGEGSSAALPELRVTFGGASVVPDVSVFLLERLPLDSRGRFANDITIPPDIAVEIMSPHQSATALVRRCRWYVANGVRIALLVDPDDETVLGFRLDDRLSEWRGADRIDPSEVLPNFDLTVDALLAVLKP